MGIYLNPGNASFRGSLRSKIYVDKSGLIAKTNDVICTEQNYNNSMTVLYKIIRLWSA